MHWRLGQFCCLRNCEIQGGIACPGDRVLFAWCEEMQVLFGSESSEGDREAPRCAILVCESESGRNVQVSMAVSETSDMGHDVFFPGCNEGIGVCVPRWMWMDIGAGADRSLRVASRDCSAQCSDDWKELQFRFALVSFGAGADRRHDGHDCKLRVHGVPEACKTCRKSAVKASRRW